MTSRSKLAAATLAGGAVLALGARPRPGPEAGSAAGTPVARFVDVAVGARLTARTVIGGERTKDFILETTGGGAAIVDYDGDGWPDVFLVNGSRLGGFGGEDPPPSRLYHNLGDGTFADVTEGSGLARRGWGQGVCAGDYDNDGRVDLFVTYYGQNALYRNQGGGVFRDATRTAGLAGPDRYSTGCAFLDYDRDGRLDLFVSAYVDYEDAVRYRPGTGSSCSWKGLVVMCGPAGLRGALNALYHGNGDGTFTDVSAAAGILKAAPSFGFTPLALDYDNDGWTDVYVTSDSRASLLFHNERDGTFK